MSQIGAFARFASAEAFPKGLFDRLTPLRLQRRFCVRENENRLDGAQNYFKFFLLQCNCARLREEFTKTA